MQPARFVTFSFLYSGALLVAQQLLFYQLLSVTAIANFGAGLCILFTGLYRLLYPEKEEHRPTEYGLLTYGMAVLAIVLTAIVLGQTVLFFSS